MKRIQPVVEGDGDMLAVPALVRRIAHDAGCFDVKVLRPHKRGDIPTVRARFEDYLRVALLEACPVLWVLDYDCETCNDLARDKRELSSRAAEVAQGAAVQIAFMVKEFETLFLADHETTRVVFPDIPPETLFPPDPESVRDAKGWLSQARPKGLAYKPSQHQERLASQVDLGRLRLRSPTFVQFENAVVTLLEAP